GLQCRSPVVGQRAIVESTDVMSDTEIDRCGSTVRPAGRATRTVATFLLLIAAAGPSACADSESRRLESPPPVPFTGVVEGISVPGVTTEDGEWHRPAKEFASTRFSMLTEITTANVANLQEAWSFSLGIPRGQEAAPVIVNGTMYVVTAFPNVLYAL